MKKPTTEKKEAFNPGYIEWYDCKTAMEGLRKTEKRTDIPLGKGVTMSIFESSKDYDFGSINVFGFSINVTYRNGKNGMFLSFPSVKTAKGDYSNLVSCFDKDFHALAREVLEAFYS